MLDGVLAFLLVFGLRLGDVPVGTLRTILMIQGRKSLVFALALCESFIWLIAISRVLNAETLSNPWKVSGYVTGFATGVVVGMQVEAYFAIGSIIVRAISTKFSEPLRERLLAENFGVTAVDGRGRHGPVSILFIVCPRKRLRELLRIVEQVDPKTVVTHDAVTPAVGGFHGWKGRAGVVPWPHQ